MKVLVLSHLYPSDLSATWGSFVHNQARFLSERVAVQVVAPVSWAPVPVPGPVHWNRHRRLPRRERRDGIAVERPRFAHLPRRLWPQLTIRRYAAAVAPFTAPVPDLIHAHCAFPDGAAAALWGQRLGVPVVVTVHGADVKDLPRLSRRWRCRIGRTLQAAQAVIAVSAELESLVLDLGVAGTRLHRIPNGVDSELFAAPGHRRAGGPGRLLYVGRFDPAKGLEDLLHALRHLRDRDLDVHLDLVGANPLSGPAAPFQRLADRLGLQDSVSFHDEVPWTEVPRRMAAADLFVLPSHSEGLPLVLLEAQAAGLPIVATRCGGPAEVVDDVSGRLVEVGDRPGLAEAIAEVLAHIDRYDGEAIRRRAAQAYDYRSVAARIHAVYQGVAGHPAPIVATA